MAISDVRSFPDYEFMDVGNYQPIRLDTITISTEAYASMQHLIERLKEENKHLEYHVSRAESYCRELEDELNAIKSERVL